ncbi:hypothetical protein KGF56_002893 [Candida oxycetoniae]|uniref:C3H1-type domain-containing protein n=1 Tax=Candida oxycetoniae TaxID=497107 RepID=A0AAI9SWP2_9ASCO|nr:uncharacterized protein KGF56_002893 [Candida oxycetoniae]KAI3404254.2 hypothetical protein KGF56_002893 [Candida oxycetoniae]
MNAPTTPYQQENLNFEPIAILDLPNSTKPQKHQSTFTKSNSHKLNKTCKTSKTLMSQHSQHQHQHQQQQQQQPANTNQHKATRSIDSSEISAFFPPNSGPLGTVLVTNSSHPTGTTNGASNSNSNSNNSGKSLSHVPCKFFKQGICQAGDSCPFSHQVEGALSADKLPCKYFLKGNCKFGMKCALAHYLPDGTKVNAKNILQENNDSYAYDNIGNGNKNRGYSSYQTQNSGHNQYLMENFDDFSEYEGRALYQNNMVSDTAAIVNSKTAFNPFDLQQQQQSQRIIKPQLQIPISLNSVQSESLARSNSLNQRNYWQSPPQRFDSQNSSPIEQIKQSIGQHQDMHKSLDSSSSSYSHHHHHQHHHKHHHQHHHQQNNHQTLKLGPTNSYYNSSAIPFVSDYKQPSSFQTQSWVNTSYSHTGFNIPLASSSLSPPQSLFAANFQPVNSTSATPTSKLPFGSKLSALHSPFYQNFESVPRDTFQYYQYRKLLSSKVFDDDDEEEEDREKNGGVTNNSDLLEEACIDQTNCNQVVFEEDFLPSSLADVILTPQELKHRDSRSQSGTLSIRPTFDGFQSHDSRFLLSDRGKEQLLSHHEDVFLME